MNLDDLRALYDFTGQTVLVTGGAGVLGLAMVRTLVECNANVIVLSRNQERAAQSLAEITRQEKGRGRASYVHGDVLNIDALHQADQTIRSQFGSVDILVNAAGGNHPSGTTTPHLSFFDLPLDEKMKTHGRERSRGYGPLGEEALSYGLGKAAPADVKEGLYEGPMDVPDTPYFRGPEGAPHFVPNIWPARPPELREVWRAYYGQMERLARDIMRIFAVALDLPERFFDDKIDKHVSRVRAINYPDQREAPLPGQLRVARRIEHAMEGGDPSIIGPVHHEVADIDHEGVGYRFHV